MFSLLANVGVISGLALLAYEIRLYIWLVSALRVREFSWLQWHSGVIDDAQRRSELSVTVAILQAPRVRLWREAVGKKTVSSEFASCVDAQIPRTEPSNGIYEGQMRWVNLQGPARAVRSRPPSTPPPCAAVGRSMHAPSREG